MRLLLMLFHFVQEMVFDSKDEYNIKSPKFNLKKVLIISVLLFSLIINVFLIYNFVKVANLYLELQVTHEQIKNTKIKDPVSSNSQKP